MMSSDLERAEFYLCLARSFLPPVRQEMFAALRDMLADDLEALCGAIGYPAAEPLRELRASLSAIPDADRLSQLYTRLFVAPPRLANLATGVYLDGGLTGRSVQALEACYRRCGVERSDEFRNSSDHVAVQLEFAACLYASAAPEMAAAHFLDSFPGHWLPGFISDLEEAAAQVGANPYLQLARLLAVAVARDAVPLPRDPREERHRRALERARAKRAARGITPADLSEIERRLIAKGLSTQHLRRDG